MQLKFQASNGSDVYHHRGNASVDSNNRIHICVDLYDPDNRSRWRVGYARFDPATRTFDRMQYLNGDSDHHNYACTVTVDDNDTAYVFWNRYESGYRLVYTTIPSATGTPSALAYVLPNDRSEQTWPVARPRMAYPAGPSRSVAAGQPELFYLHRGQLRYAKLGEFNESPALAGPTDGANLNDTTPTFSWGRLTQDTGANTTYEVQWDSTPTFASATTQNTQAVTNYTLTAAEALTPGFYYWHVRATSGGQVSPWSPIWEIAIDTTPPTTFTLGTPANAAQVPTVTPSFQWNAATDP